MEDFKTMPETITITIKEYKELLIIKGKYEELKEQKIPRLVYDGFKENGKTILPYEDMKITCE